ncbi:uncharacterized protein LOC121835994, partial [Ixodes scapularis]|uniref:uncharacterized protein LOC121835994 n=1 Tax=Ixodes scapularis TaxID=6945 RepID=UPI001C3816D4
MPSTSVIARRKERNAVLFNPMELLKPPEPLLLSGNVPKNWELFRQMFELFLKATALPKEPRSEDVKTALLLSAAGDNVLEIFKNFRFAEDEVQDDYGTVATKFEEYCREQQNEVYERYIFRTRMRVEAEPFEHFLRDLRKQAGCCNFAQLTDSVIRDQVVFGTNNPKFREKMLKEKDLTLLRAEQICKAAEVSALQSEVFAQGEKLVAPVKKRQPYKCGKCNRQHERGRCPAFGKSCFMCRGTNH